VFAVKPLEHVEPQLAATTPLVTSGQPQLCVGEGDAVIEARPVALVTAVWIAELFHP